MPEETAVPVVDLDAIRKSVEGLSVDELKAKLVSARTTQKVQIERGKANYKKYAQRQRERQRMMKELALAKPATKSGFANLWEQIEAEAAEAAEEKLAEQEQAAEATA